jgi:CheY-like chemotaxis protein
LNKTQPQGTADRESPPKPDQDHQDAERIVDQANRAAVLTSQLLTVGGRQNELKSRVLDVKDFLDGVSERLRGAMGSHHKLVISASEDVSLSYCDASDLEQVLVHLLMNARDAMPDGGTVEVTATRKLIQDPLLRASSGPCVVIAVSDSGSGIPELAQAHIFEPFFTTKPKQPGVSRGLSLSLAYNIVKKQGGHLNFRSEPGRGSAFTIYLRCPTADGMPEETLVSQLPDYRGTETILLVEDKFGIRHLMSTALRARGYTVLEATGSAEALTVYQLDPVSIQLLLTDVIMPRVSGPQLSNELTALRPTLKTLYVSGRLEEELHDIGLLQQGAAFIQKPFTPEALARAVRSLLDARSL